MIPPHIQHNQAIPAAFNAVVTDTHHFLRYFEPYREALEEAANRLNETSMGLTPTPEMLETHVTAIEAAWRTIPPYERDTLSRFRFGDEISFYYRDLLRTDN